MNQVVASMFDVDPETVAIEDIDVSQPRLFSEDRIWPLFERLRRDAPVHYCRASAYGSYWSITRFEDIRYVDTHHDLFSSDGAITIGEDDEEDELELPMFIAMDPPIHDAQRKVVAPAVAPMNLKSLAGTIRERAGRILDSLPVGETFDWVERVSVVLTGQMLAPLFDMPIEDRLKLSRWSDVGAHGVTSGIIAGVVEDSKQYHAEMQDCLDYFTRLWNQRIAQPPRNDLISMLAHGESTRQMSPEEFLGNLVLLIVGGNDTTRNSISGGVVALNQFPAEHDKLRADVSLIPNMVSEIIRYQTPVSHMRRTATADTELGGNSSAKAIR